MCNPPKHGQSRSFLDRFRSRSCHKYGDRKLIPAHAIGGWNIPYPPSPPPRQSPEIPVPPSPPPPSYERHDPALTQTRTGGAAQAQAQTHHMQPKNTQTSGEMHYQSPVDVRFHGGGPQGPGYIRIQGGHTHASWRNFDANIPTSELIGANENQQAAIYQALALGAQKSHRTRDHNTYNTYSYHGRIEDIPDSRALPAPGPASASAQLNNNHNDEPHNDNASTAAASTRSASSPAAKFCSACGRSKTPNTEDVKHIRQANAVLCYGCVYAHFGAEFQRVWFEN